MKTTLVWILFGALVISNTVFGLLLLLNDGQQHTQNNARDVVVENDDQQDTLPAVAGARQSQSVLETVDLQTTAYESKASSFSLEIDPEYVVVVEKDGGANELKSTILKIARRGSSADTVSLGADDFVAIEAYPTKTNGTRDQFITADTALQDNAADESTATIDGIPARKFVLAGVGETVKYFFERNGITYFIEAWDVSSGDTQQMIDDTIRGFRFL